MLSEKESDDVVQSAVFQAGGFQGAHPGTRNLSQAGLIRTEQRQAFQPAVGDEVAQRHHDIGDLSKIPNGPTTKISEVTKYVHDNATPIPPKEG